jgi:hypothetical protein
MPFSRDIKEEAMIAAARHCCVCHNFKGRNVEVHHIVPEAENGKSDLDNAIVLCFDCHADAGHYNPKHPRGTKYQPSELRRHRDLWHEEVKQRSIQPPESIALHYNYLICKSFDVFKEVATHDLSRLPIKDVLLVDSEVLGFQKWVVNQKSSIYGHRVVYGPTYSDIAVFERNHPDRVQEVTTAHERGTFHREWQPRQLEIEQFVAPHDFLIPYLTRGGTEPSELIVAGAWVGPGCGADSSASSVSVYYRLRDVWAAYLLVTNTTSRSIQFLNVSGVADFGLPVEYRKVKIGIGIGAQILPLPPALVRPNQSILIPLFTFMPPWEEEGHSLPILDEWLPSGQGQIVRHGKSNCLSDGSHVVGPAFWPQSIVWDGDGAKYAQAIKTVDLDNLYSIDRYWGAGCCPHLFFVFCDGTVTYAGELFAKCQDDLCADRIEVPAGVRLLAVAELEDETTTISEIDGSCLSPAITLERGQYIVFPFVAPGRVTFVGKYSVRGRAPVNLLNPWKKRRVIDEFAVTLRDRQADCGINAS